jgi:hypothetical protein
MLVNPELLITGKDFPVVTKDIAETLNIPRAITSVLLNGLSSVGDCEPILCNRVAVEPAHTGKFQDNAGAWFEYVLLEPSARQFGAVINGITDDSDAFNNLAAYVIAKGIATANFGSGVSVVSKQITWPANTSIVGGDFTFDAMAAVVNGVTFPNGAVFYCSGGALVALPDLNANVSKGAITLVFNAPHGLSRNQTGSIYNPVDFSFNVERSYYRAGEMFKVRTVVNDTTVTIYRPLQADYVAATVDCYVRPNKTLKLNFTNFEVKAPDTLGACVKLVRLDDPLYNNLTVIGSKDYGFHVAQLYNGFGENLVCGQVVQDGSGTQYGMVVANCEYTKASGQFFGFRHGYAQGGDAEVGCTPSRYCEVHGEFFSAPISEGGGYALDAHGNCVNWFYSGTAFGGLSFSGNYGKFRGRCIAHPGYEAMSAGPECLGLDFDFIGVVIEDGGGTTTETGLFNFGGDGGGLSVNSPRGGTLDLTDMKVISPTGTRPFYIRNRGYNGSDRIVVNMSGVVIERANATCVMTFDAPAGKNWTVFNVQGFVYPDATTFGLGAIDIVRGWSRTINKTVTSPGGVTTLEFTEAWAATPFATIAPKVTVSLKGEYPNSVDIGGTAVTCRAIAWVGDVFTTTWTVFVGMTIADCDLPSGPITITINATM